METKNLVLNRLNRNPKIFNVPQVYLYSNNGILGYHHEMTKLTVEDTK